MLPFKGVQNTPARPFSSLLPAPRGVLYEDRMSDTPEAIAATIQKSNPINLAICAVVVCVLAGCYSLLKANEGADRLGQRLDALTSKIETLTFKIERCAPEQVSAIGHAPRRSERDVQESPLSATHQTKTAASESSPYPQCRIPAGTL